MILQSGGCIRKVHVPVVGSWQNGKYQTLIWLQEQSDLVHYCLSQNLGSLCELPHDKTNKMACAPSEDSSAWASVQSDQSSLCTQWVAKDPRFLHADSEDTDHIRRMLSLICVFAGHTLILLVLSCRGSCYFQILVYLAYPYSFIHLLNYTLTWIRLSRTWWKWSNLIASNSKTVY